MPLPKIIHDAIHDASERLQELVWPELADGPRSEYLPPWVVGVFVALVISGAMIAAIGL